jgi:hypothetical protein
MRLPRLAATLLVLVAVPAPAAAEDTLRLELNTAESVQSRCLASFLLENKSDRQIESLKLDLVIFGAENTMQHRMVIEIGPVRRAKTVVRSYEIERGCAQIGAILVNDILACEPGEPGACLDQLALSSRVPGVRVFK